MATVTVLPISTDDVGNYEYIMVGGYNGTNVPDLYCIQIGGQTKSGFVELSKLVGPSSTDMNHFVNFETTIVTGLSLADFANCKFLMGDTTGAGRPDLICIKNANTASRSIEMNICGVGNGWQPELKPLYGYPDVDLWGPGSSFEFAVTNISDTPDLAVAKLLMLNNDTTHKWIQVYGWDIATLQCFDYQIYGDNNITVEDCPNYKFTSSVMVPHNATLGGVASAEWSLFFIKIAQTASGYVEVRALMNAGGFPETLVGPYVTPIPLYDVANYRFQVTWHPKLSQYHLWALKCSNTMSGRVEMVQMLATDMFATLKTWDEV